MIREKIRQAIFAAVQQCFGAGDAAEFSVAPTENPEHGDYATNAAFSLAKKTGKNPMEIAAELQAGLRGDPLFRDIIVAEPGFLNFRLASEAFFRGLREVLERGEQFGARDFGAGRKARVEYVSANPTGPIHIGNARGGPIGETIVRVLQKCGYEVLREYIHNDIGTQVEKMGATLWYWYQKIGRAHV